MSEYTTRQILDMIERNGGPQDLNLSGEDLRGIDLDRETIQAELEWARKDEPGIQPAWLSKSGGINLAKTNLQGAILWGARLRGACLEGAELEKAVLSAANLKEAHFLGANLRRTDLRWALLQRADLSGANLQEADLRWADIQGCSFYSARLDRTEIDQKGLAPAIGEELAKQYNAARDAYLRLKQNFDHLGDYAASAWAYQKERQMEKECNAPWRAKSMYGRVELGEGPSPARVCWFYARHTAKWIVDWMVEYLCGYGESIGKVLFWMVGSLFAFASYYRSIGGVWLVEPGEGPTGAASSFRHYLIYSLGAFTTTQFETFQPADDRVMFVTGVQAVCGIFLAGLLGFVVANKIRRS